MWTYLSILTNLSTSLYLQTICRFNELLYYWQYQAYPHWPSLALLCGRRGWVRTSLDKFTGRVNQNTRNIIFEMNAVQIINPIILYICLHSLTARRCCWQISSLTWTSHSQCASLLKPFSNSLPSDLGWV